MRAKQIEVARLLIEHPDTEKIVECTEPLLITSIKTKPLLGRY